MLNPTKNLTKLMRTAALRSLGCKVNAYETDKIQQKLEKNGYKIVPFDTVSDIYIVNTCSVTNIADQKSRQMLHRAKKLNPEAVVVAIGCYAETGRDTLEKDSAVDLIIGNDDKMDILRILNEYFSEESDSTDNGSAGDLSFYTEVSHFTASDKTRAFLKIEDGCNRFCSYCVIPYARGRVKSREIADVTEEAGRLAQAGFREVVLTGIHICSYGTERGGSELMDLVGKLDRIEGIERIRLGSLEPAFITPEWIDRAGQIQKLCPHFHLSLQSGSDTVLKRMNRHYTAADYIRSVELLRDAFTDPAITTDIIVGFPGETDAEFGETCDLARMVGFYEPHIFKYSRRDGTAAAAMPDQVPDQVKNERSDTLISLGRELSDEYRRRHIGEAAELLTEEEMVYDGREYLVGHTAEYIKTAVAAQSSGDNRNKLVRGRLTGVLRDGAEGHDDILLMEADKT